MRKGVEVTAPFRISDLQRNVLVLQVLLNSESASLTEQMSVVLSLAMLRSYCVLGSGFTVALTQVV